MKLQLNQARLQNILKQRNMMMFGMVGLFALNILQGISLIIKNERTIVIPAQISQQFWVENGQASTQYLEEMGVFFANLVLNTSPANAGFQRNILLRYALSGSYGQLKGQLVAHEARLKKDNVSTSFKPVEISANPKTNVVMITGELDSYVAQRQVTHARKTYKVELAFQQGRVLLKSFMNVEEVKNDKK